MTPRQQVLRRLRASLASGRKLVISGAANGLNARAVEAGGGDLVVVYSSGRFRAAGRSSLSALMPYANANEIVESILPEVVRAVGECPVVAALCGTDPFRDLDELVANVATIGASGVQNFPTIGMLGAELRDDLEATGISFEQEVELIRAARRADLLAGAYVTTEADARQMALAGADLIVPLLGVTRPRDDDAALEAAASQITAIANAALAVRDDMIILFHGGPVDRPEQVQRCYEMVPVLHGYVAASSVERTPVQSAIEEAVRSFVALGNGGRADSLLGAPDFDQPPPELPVELDPSTLPSYLRGRGLIGDLDAVEVDELGGGLSNVVLRWRRGDRSGVVKQSRPRLRVAEEWLSDVRRIINERDAISCFDGRLRRGRVPRITFADDAALAFGMEEVPAGAQLWKPLLLAGQIDPDRGRQAGELLGEMHALTLDDPLAKARFVAQPLLGQNRLDPWYRATARSHPDLVETFEYAIERLLGLRRVLVHGDFVPKNLFLLEDQLMIVDFEVAHFGNPGYDVATIVNHLLLKGFAMPQHRERLVTLVREAWDGYCAQQRTLDLGLVEQEALVQLGALMLCRLDGKSKVEYLADQPGAEKARRLGRWLMRNQPGSLEEALRRFLADD